jgi:hypothetical protein
MMTVPQVLSANNPVSSPSTIHPRSGLGEKHRMPQRYEISIIVMVYTNDVYRRQEDYH